MEKQFEEVTNPLNNEPVVTDIISVYNKTLQKLKKIDKVLASYKEGVVKNKEIEKIYKDILGKESKKKDTLQEDEDIGF
tara:strand:+ start:32177 stop:32413 length:237 start_codon:yes stop_codon:yes gene_type:complete